MNVSEICEHLRYLLTCNSPFFQPSSDLALKCAEEMAEASAEECRAGEVEEEPLHSKSHSFLSVESDRRHSQEEVGLVDEEDAWVAAVTCVWATARWTACPLWLLVPSGQWLRNSIFLRC